MGGSRTLCGLATGSPLVPGWVQSTMLGKDLPSQHLIVSGGFANGTTAFIKLDRSALFPVVLVSLLVLVLVHLVFLVLVHRVTLVERLAFLGYDALARFRLAGDDGRIGRQDEGRWRLFGLFDLGGQALGGAALGADALLVLLPEPGGEYEGPDGYHGRAGCDGGDYGGFGAVTFFILQ